MNNKDKKALEDFEKEFDKKMEELNSVIAEKFKGFRDQLNSWGIDETNKEDIKKQLAEAYRQGVQQRKDPKYADLGAWGKYQEVWRLDDKAWLAERKTEWRKVSKNLDLIHKHKTDLPKRLRKYHKELFFYGKIHKKLRTDPTPFAYSQLFFLMWYFPDPSEEVFREFCGACPAKGGELEKARDMLLDYSYLGKDDYGLLGGREALFAKVLIPPLDCKQELTFQPNGEVLKGLWPLSVFTKCVRNSHALLASWPSGKWPSPYVVGQYLWDQMDYAFEHYYSEISAIDKYGDNFFLFGEPDRNMLSEISYLFDLLYMLLDFDEREGAPRDNPVARSLRERLLSRFNARGFSPRLMAVWDEVKAHYESGSQEPLWGLF
jgi:hypothetical protein